MFTALNVILSLCDSIAKPVAVLIFLLQYGTNKGDLRFNLYYQVFIASVVSILLYGCESWVIDEELEKQINSFATTCYRSLLGIKWCDHVSNEKVLEKVKKAPLIDTVRKRQLGWLGHTLRLEDQEPAKTFALYEPKHGSFKRGPRPLSYKHQIAKLLSDSPDDLTIEAISEMARNKKKWSEIVAAHGRFR